MKAVKVKELFGTVPNRTYHGRKSVFTYNWYIVRDEWIEEVTYETI